MNKKLMAVAVAGAFGMIGAPAYAQLSKAGDNPSTTTGSSVTINGRLNFFYGNYNSGGNGTTINGAPTTNSKQSYDGLNNSESELDLKGQENLGGGMAAWFQCGSTLDVLGTSSQTGNAGLCGRNSAIGLKGNWGNVFAGNWDTPIKTAMTPFSVFPQANPIGNGLMYNGSANDAGNIAAPASSTTISNLSQFNQTGGGAAFWRRQSRLISYVTPEFKGFQAAAAFSAANDSSAMSVGNGIRKPRLYSFGSNYNNGPLKLNLGFEMHVDYNPGGLTQTLAGPGAGAAGFSGNYSGGKDTAWMLGAGYKFLNDSVVVNFQWIRMDYQISGNLTTNQTNWNVNGAWNIAGPHTIKLGYVDMGATGGTYGAVTGPANNPCTLGTGNAAGGCAAMVGTIVANGGAGGTGAKKYIAEYQYALSKRSNLNIGYAKTNNDAQSNINIGTGATAPGFGESQSFYGVRMEHLF